MTQTGRIERRHVETAVREGLARVLGNGDEEKRIEAGAELTPPAAPTRDPSEVFESAEAVHAKREIVRAARKLWLREYVDGNGGNISFRLTDDYVLCTPTLLSKADVRPGDIAMVDLHGRQVAGAKRRSSEISLHVAIMRAVPAARAVIHCHPPHATAYAVTGRVPPEWLLAEPEVFLGPIGWVPYQTPGTEAGADAAADVATRHNTLMLANHGIVCWADTVTHAEWHVEILDTYCRTLLLAAQLPAPLAAMPREKVRELLELKRGLGLPDVRYDLSAEDLAARTPAPESGIAVPPPAVAAPAHVTTSREDFERVVKDITDAVMARTHQGESNE